MRSHLPNEDALSQTALGGPDARVKLGFSLSLVACVLLDSRPYCPACIALFSIAFTFASGVQLRCFIIRLMPAGGLALMVLLFRMFFSGEHPWFHIPLGDATLTASIDGARTGLLMASKILGAVSATLMMSLTTPVHQILRALAWFRFPSIWVDVAVLMIRYLFVLYSQAENIRNAQRLRLGYRGLFRSISSLGSLTGAILIRSYDQSFRTYQAMQLRGMGDAAFPRAKWPLGRIGALQLVLASFGPLGVWFSIGRLISP